MSIRRKVLDSSGEIEGFNRALLKVADKFTQIGWADEEDVFDAVASGGYKTTAMLMRIVNEALSEGEQEYRLVIEGDVLAIVQLDS